MESNFEKKTKKSAFNNALGIFFNIILVVLVSLSVIICAFTCVGAFSPNPENTLEFFGYKIFCANENIDGTDIEKGSLVIIKDSADDENYTADFLNSNSVKIKSLGNMLNENSELFSISVFSVPILIFLIVIFEETKKKIILSGERDTLDYELNDEFE